MKWCPETPSVEGQHIWRENEHSRVHSVRAKIRKGKIEWHCKTMDLRKILTGGQWKKSDQPTAND